MLPLRVDGTRIIDSEGREVLLRGINLSGDSKLPKNPAVPSHEKADFWETDCISFSGRPFELDDADVHLARIASWGYNIVRFVITWEAVEHAGPGKYDDEYIDYVLAILRKCGDHGLYVLMDPHQDVWSRYSGGSGAPFWTFVAAGMDPRNFQATEAAIVHNVSSDPTTFPRMIWATNYDRMAAATMFTLFFAGEYFAPKAIINGLNIQDFLQSHFINAMVHFSQRIKDAGDLLDSIVIGWETMNEPSQAWIGNPDLSTIHPDQQLRKGTCPSPFQAMVTASGYRQTIPVYEFGAMGAKKKGTTIVDPLGISIWLQKDYLDAKYGFHRDAAWPLGRCIWELHGVWSRDGPTLEKPDYFKAGPDGQDLDCAGFLQFFWLQHFRKFKHAMRSSHSSAIIFCQPPVLKIPPLFSLEDKSDTQIVYAPHYYDGLTLLNKKWNTWYNVDVLGILRGRYLTPVLAVKLGLYAIRNCMRDQLIAIRDEGLENMGTYPCFFTEIGIPFDMDSKKAYTSGNYSSQIGALDANMYALEGARVHYTMWHYSPLNNNHWGDFWNGEDLSFYSRSNDSHLRPDDCQSSADGHIDSLHGAIQNLESTSHSTTNANGCRALPAFLRPAPISTSGSILKYSFDLKSTTFQVSIRISASANADGKNYSVLFLPPFHFPNPFIVSTEGRVENDRKTCLLVWWHDAATAGQSHSLTITNSKG